MGDRSKKKEKGKEEKTKKDLGEKKEREELTGDEKTRVRSYISDTLTHLKGWFIPAEQVILLNICVSGYSIEDAVKEHNDKDSIQKRGAVYLNSICDTLQKKFDLKDIVKPEAIRDLVRQRTPKVTGSAKVTPIVTGNPVLNDDHKSSPVIIKKVAPSIPAKKEPTKEKEKVKVDFLDSNEDDIVLDEEKKENDDQNDLQNFEKQLLREEKLKKVVKPATIFFPGKSTTPSSPDTAQKQDTVSLDAVSKFLSSGPENAVQDDNDEAVAIIDKLIRKCAYWKLRALVAEEKCASTDTQYKNLEIKMDALKKQLEASPALKAKLVEALQVIEEE